MIDSKILPNHFITYKYVKHEMGAALQKLLNEKLATTLLSNARKKVLDEMPPITELEHTKR